jgi:DNA-binding SARP family transcriptional activator
VALTLGDRESSLAAAQAAAADDPLDEEAQRAIMRSFWLKGEPGEALVAYERLRTCLVEQLGADPGPETERLYLANLRGEADPGETPSLQDPAD